MTPPETDVEQKDCFAGPVLLDDPQSLELFQENSFGITRLYTDRRVGEVRIVIDGRRLSLRWNDVA